MNHRRKNQGFTLLEVVVAVAILGLAVGAGLADFQWRLQEYPPNSQMAHVAMNHAENIMNEILADQSILGPMQLTGTLDERLHIHGGSGLLGAEPGGT